jgi:hypothetical protein
MPVVTALREEEEEEEEEDEEGVFSFFKLFFVAPAFSKDLSSAASVLPSDDDEL